MVDATGIRFPATKRSAITHQRGLATGRLVPFLENGLGMRLSPKAHGPLVDVLEVGDWDELLLLMARGHFKTSIVCGYCAWRISQNRNFRGFAACVNAEPKGQELILLIETMLERERIVQWFSSFKTNVWSTERFIVSGRGRDMPLKDPTMGMCGISAFRPGGHLDLLIWEDVEDQETVKTEDMRRATQSLDGLAYPMVDEPGAKRITTGTFYDDADVYNYKIDNLELPRKKLDTKADESASTWAPPIHGGRSPDGREVCIYVPAEDEDGEPTFPERFSKAALDKLRRRMGEDHYARQYLLNPGLSKDKTFPPQFRTFVDEAPRAARYDISIDAARSLVDTRALTGIAAMATDEHGAWTILEAREERYDADELIRELFALHAAYLGRPRFWIEEEGYITGLKKSIRRAMQDRGIWLNITYVSAFTRPNKDKRILAMQAPWKERAIRFLRGGRIGQGVGQFDRYPHTKRKDILDAMATLLEYAGKARPDGRDRDADALSHLPRWLARHLDPRLEEKRKNQPFLGRRGDSVPAGSA